VHYVGRPRTFHIRISILRLGTSDPRPSKTDRFFPSSRHLPHLTTSHHLLEETISYQILKISLLSQAHARGGTQSTIPLHVHHTAERVYSQRPLPQIMVVLAEDQVRLCLTLDWEMTILWKLIPGMNPNSVEDNPFAISPKQLSKMFNPKSFAAFQALRGLPELVKGLRTDSSSGLSLDETALDGTVEFDEVTILTSSAFPPQGNSSPSDPVRSTPSSPIRLANSERFHQVKIHVFHLHRVCRFDVTVLISLLVFPL
jgi:hypothetical protein